MKRTPSPAERLAKLDRSIYLVGRHRAAGHDLSNPKFVIDLTSLLLNARRLHDIVGPIPQEREILSYLARNTATHEETENIMAGLDEITAATARISAAQTATADEIRKIAAQLSSGVTPAQITAAADALNAIADAQTTQAADVDALVDIAGEDDVVEPPTEPTV